MAVPKDVKAVLIKVFQVLKEDPSKLTNLPPEYCGGWLMKNIQINLLMLLQQF